MDPSQVIIRPVVSEKSYVLAEAGMYTFRVHDKAHKTNSLRRRGTVKLDGVAYPEGKIITLPFDPTTKLSVYTGEFMIEARIAAAPGNHLVQARLYYQACDQNQCLPPKTIIVPIDVIGK